MADMSRRNFLKTSAVASASVAALGTAGSVMASEKATTMAFPGVIYTAEQEGKWKGKAGSHAPKVKVEGNKVSVQTVHGMSEEHFIVRHTIVLQDGTEIGGKTFTPSDSPESSFELPAGYKGKAYATSFCNQHDMWLTEFSV